MTNLKNDPQESSRFISLDRTWRTFWLRTCSFRPRTIARTWVFDLNRSVNDYNFLMSALFKISSEINFEIFNSHAITYQVVSCWTLLDLSNQRWRYRSCDNPFEAKPNFHKYLKYKYWRNFKKSEKFWRKKFSKKFSTKNLKKFERFSKNFQKKYQKLSS